MKLFNLKKEIKEEKETSCACNAPTENEKKESCCCNEQPANTITQSCDCTNKKEEIKSIKVLGSGCKSCHKMYENAKATLESAKVDIKVEYVTDIEEIMKYGVMSMPALVINEKVVSTGKVLKQTDLKQIFNI